MIVRERCIQGFRNDIASPLVGDGAMQTEALIKFGGQIYRDSSDLSGVFEFSQNIILYHEHNADATRLLTCRLGVLTLYIKRYINYL